jgi:hypothetical protein
MKKTEFSYLAELAANCHKSPMGKFKGFIVDGELRAGKTTYSIKVMRDIFKILNPGISDDDAYDMALAHMNFKLKPFLERVREKQREIKAMLPRIDWSRRIPVLTLDDASLYAGVDLYFRSQKLYSAFQGTMTTIGTACSALILTAPKVDALAKPIREFYDYLPVRITEYDEYRREATIREWYTARSGRLNKRKVAIDQFTPRVPNKHYARYLKDRIELGEEAIDDLLDAVKEGEVKEDIAAKTLRGLPNFHKMRGELADAQKRAGARSVA